MTAPLAKSPAHTPVRGGKGRWVRTVDQAERDGRAARLRSQGLTLAEIAAELGYESVEGARMAVRRALLAAAAEGGGAELLALEAEHLEAIRRETWEIVRRDHWVVSAKGEIVLDPDTGKPLIDDGIRTNALNTLVRVSESIRRLYGLDARDGLREREVRVKETELALNVRVLEIAARALGWDVDSTHVSAAIGGAIEQAEREFEVVPAVPR